METTVSERIKEIRKQLKLTQLGFGKEIGVGQGAVSAWEQGEKTPSFETLSHIRSKWGIDLNWLITGQVNSTAIGNGGHVAQAVVGPVVQVQGETAGQLHSCLELVAQLREQLKDKDEIISLLKQRL